MYDMIKFVKKSQQQAITAQISKNHPYQKLNMHVVKTLNTGKSPGLDGVPAELIKATGSADIKLLHKLFVSMGKLSMARRLGNPGVCCFILRLEIRKGVQTVESLS